MSLRNIRRSDWQAGIEAAYAYPTTCSVFVTPPIDDWVLCVGFPLVSLVDARPPEFGRRAAEWAAALQTDVQYFATHRIVEAHAWARARPSGVERAYLYVGESGQKVQDDGPQTVEEKLLEFAFFDPECADAQADNYWERQDLTYVTEAHVMALAHRWSVDPSSLGERNLDLGDGLIADFGEPPPQLPAPTSAATRQWWKFW
jgi:hypothetical protein